MTRTSLAFVVAPLWVPPLLFVFAGLGGYPSPGSWPLIIALVSLLCAYIGEAAIGLPAFLLMRSRRWTAGWMAAGVGLLAGLLTAYGSLLVMCLLRGPGSMRSAALLTALDLPLLAVSALTGAVVGGTVWLIARPDRPSAVRLADALAPG